MAHWRDGGIGNMAGSDDRPIEEWTLLEKLANVATTDPNGSIVQEAFDEIQKLRDDCARALLLATKPAWQPIATAPVPPYERSQYNARWGCLLQNERGNVFEGWAYWVPPPLRHPDRPPILRWGCSIGQCFPKYWMPLPESLSNEDAQAIAQAIVQPQE